METRIFTYNWREYPIQEVEYVELTEQRNDALPVQTIVVLEGTS